MIVWLWDADGPGGSASGVTDDPAAACHAAEEGMAVTGATMATVETAMHLAGGGWMRARYRPTGHVRIAWRRDGGVAWTESYRLMRAAS